MSVVPKYITQQFGLGAFAVGIVIAVQYVAMLLARPIAGIMVDRRGPKAALRLGLLFFMLCGLGYLLSAWVKDFWLGLSWLVLGRAMMGMGESYIVTGALSWAMRHVGQANAGMVMSWNGNAMYGGVAIGGPVASMLSHLGGLEIVAWFVLVLGGLAAVNVATLFTYAPFGGKRQSIYRTMTMIVQPGTGLLLASVGYGTILGFATLFFQQNGWGSSFFAIFSFGAAYVAMRIFFGGTPDRYGGIKVAFWSLMLESAGQAILFLSSTEYTALLGAALSGAGFSLVVPALGVEAVRRVSQQARGVAMASYLTFFDLAFGVAIPLAGLVAEVFTIRLVYLFGLICGLIGLVMVAGIKPRAVNADPGI